MGDQQDCIPLVLLYVCINAVVYDRVHEQIIPNECSVGVFYVLDDPYSGLPRSQNHNICLGCRVLRD
jgi:hypothetical protein